MGGKEKRAGCARKLRGQGSRQRSLRLHLHLVAKGQDLPSLTTWATAADRNGVHHLVPPGTVSRCCSRIGSYNSPTLETTIPEQCFKLTAILLLFYPQQSRVGSPARPRCSHFSWYLRRLILDCRSHVISEHFDERALHHQKLSIHSQCSSSIRACSSLTDLWTMDCPVCVRTPGTCLPTGLWK